jgi:hypothetical protein
MKVGAGISQMIKISMDNMKDEECNEGKGNNGKGLGGNKCNGEGKGGNNETGTAGNGTGKGRGMDTTTGGRDGQGSTVSKGKGRSGNQGKGHSVGKGKGPNRKNGKGSKDMEDSEDKELDMYEMVFWKSDGQGISKVQYNELIGQWIKKPVAKCSCASKNMCPAHGGGKWGNEDNWKDDLFGSDSDSSSEEYGSDSDEYGSDSDSDNYGSDVEEYDSDSDDYGSGGDEYGSDEYGSGENSEEDGSGTWSLFYGLGKLSPSAYFCGT